MSANFDDGGWAYPTRAGATDFTLVGMTLLDYFAGQAMQGEISAHAIEKGICRREDFGGLAQRSYEIAQAMVAEKRRLEENNDKDN